MSDLDPPLRTFAPALPMTTVASHLACDGYSERDIQTIIHDTELAEIRYRSHQIYSSQVHVDEKLFHEYPSFVFIPYIVYLRTAEASSGELATCLMDSALLHVSERSLRLFGKNHVLTVAFPAHTTNIFRAFALVFFGMLKRFKTTVDGRFDDNSVKDRITEPIQAYEQTAISITVLKFILLGGDSFEHIRAPLQLRLNEESLRKNLCFHDIWDREIKIEELPPKRHAQRFLIMNSEFII
jgi:hypothetical protein